MIYSMHWQSGVYILASMAGLQRASRLLRHILITNTIRIYMKIDGRYTLIRIYMRIDGWHTSIRSLHSAHRHNFSSGLINQLSEFFLETIYDNLYITFPLSKMVGMFVYYYYCLSRIVLNLYTFLTVIQSLMKGANWGNCRVAIYLWLYMLTMKTFHLNICRAWLHKSGIV